MFARELPGESLGLATSRLSTCAALPDGGGHKLVPVLSILVNTLGLVDNPNGSTVNCQEVPL